MHSCSTWCRIEGTPQTSPQSTFEITADDFVRRFVLRAGAMALFAALNSGLGNVDGSTGNGVAIRSG
ncbi:MAG: hypothetical protein ACP5E5_03490 [Acidobacteriaceae bacterium]